MARLLIVHNRTPAGGWQPVGVVLGTPARLDFRFLPGQAQWQRWAENVMVNATPPYKDGTGLDPTRGTWEDWITWAVSAFSNGHDAWMTEITEPEPTLDANYQQYVLGSKPDLTPPTLRPPTDDIPELDGFTKVRPR